MPRSKSRVQIPFPAPLFPLKDLLVNNTEQVLCIQKDHLPKPWVQQRSVIEENFDKFIQQCTHAGFAFIDRPKAENDPSLKQIIPYILLQTSDRKKTAVYSRNGSEKRLHDLQSIGIGGHINPVDLKHNTDNFKQILMSGMHRELEEELELRPQNELPDFVGIISEDITDVGKVHLGAVFRILTDHPEKFIPGEELFNFQWVGTNSLAELNLELWSELALELIS